MIVSFPPGEFQPVDALVEAPPFPAAPVLNNDRDRGEEWRTVRWNRLKLINDAAERRGCIEQ